MALKKDENTLSEKTETKNKTVNAPFLHKKKQANSTIEVRRFNADTNEGLSQKQVDERIAQGLVNKTGKKYSKTYRSIFIGNICTFFNLLCLIAAFALIMAHADISQFLFVAIFRASYTSFTIALKSIPFTLLIIYIFLTFLLDKPHYASRPAMA